MAPTEGRLTVEWNEPLSGAGQGADMVGSSRGLQLAGYPGKLKPKAKTVGAGERRGIFSLAILAVAAREIIDTTRAAGSWAGAV